MHHISIMFKLWLQIGTHVHFQHQQANLWPLPRPLINEHAIVSTLGCHTPTQSPSNLPCQKQTPCKVRVAFSKPVHAARERIGPPGTNYGTFTSKPSSYLQVAQPASLCPTLSADAELACKCIETIFSAHCEVWCNQKCTIKLKSVNFINHQKVISVAVLVYPSGLLLPWFRVTSFVWSRIPVKDSSKTLIW